MCNLSDFEKVHVIYTYKQISMIFDNFMKNRNKNEIKKRQKRKPSTI